jgi:hypothetical protein
MVGAIPGGCPDYDDFSEEVKVIQGDEKQVRNLGYNPRNTLGIGFSGKDDFLLFSLFTVIENQNLLYNWNYKFAKEDREWTIVSKNVKKSRTR